MGEKLKAYQTTILKRVECEKKAFDIVNKLIDETVDGDYLIRCVSIIIKIDLFQKNNRPEIVTNY